MRIDGWFDFADAAFPFFAGWMLVASAAIATAWPLSLALHRRAAARHALWLSALAVVLLGPALVWLGEALRLPSIAPPRFASMTEPVAVPIRDRIEPEKIAVLESTTVDVEPAQVASMSRAEEAAGPPRSWARTARAVGLAVWLLGSLGLLVRLIHGCRRVARLRRDVRPLPTAVEALLPRVASVLGASVDRLPAIGVSEKVAQPLTLGLVRPLVLIPEGLAENLSADELRDVLIHECAHALRRDAAVGLLQRFAAVACWPNPLIVVMNRALESAREELCDNHVLRASSPADYAASLLKIALLRPPGGELDALLGLPFIARRGALEGRVKGLVDPLRNASTAAPRVLSLGLAILFLASSAALAAIRFGDDDQASAVPKTRIEGVVVNAAGDPAAGALVHASTTRDFWGSSLETTADRDGRFTFDLDLDGLPAGVALVASNADGSLLSKLDFLLANNPTTPVSGSRLVLGPTREVAVHVTDSRGEPVADAAVSVEDGLPTQSTFRTNEKGEARFRVPLSAWPRQVVAFKSGVGLDYHKGDSIPPERVELVLNGAITTRVRVVDSENKPVAGVTVIPDWIKKKERASGVSWFGACLGVRVPTDQDGIAVFDFLPRDMDQGLRFSTSRNEHLTSTHQYHIDKEPYFDSANPVDMLTARVSRGAPVTGRVFTADEKPAPGILVQAEGRSPELEEAQASARTRSDGSYRLDLPPNRVYSIGVADDQGAATTRVGIVPHEGLPLNHIDFHLEEGTIVRGRVTNKATGEPMAVHAVKLFERVGAIALKEERPAASSDETISGLERWTTTDRDGRYSFRVAQGSYHSPAPEGLSPRSDPFEVIGQAEIVFDFAIEAPEPAAADRE